eukprot:2893858-Pleurochrysis_carterae.AAC.4
MASDLIYEMDQICPTSSLDRSGGQRSRQRRSHLTDASRVNVKVKTGCSACWDRIRTFENRFPTSVHRTAGHHSTGHPVP